jgi:hypothetical protein
MKKQTEEILELFEQELNSLVDYNDQIDTAIELVVYLMSKYELTYDDMD